MTRRAPSARIAEKERRLSSQPNVAAPSKTKGVVKPQAATRSRKKQKTEPKQEPVSSVPRQDDFRKIKGRRGHLKAITEVPYDVLLEIFSHLEPVDLLNISRATKEFRAFITGDNATSLWKQVYKSFLQEEHYLTIPPRPAAMSFTQYTNILFGVSCQFCMDNSKVTVTHFSTKVRLCKQCALTQLKLDSTFRIDENDADERAALSLCTPSYSYLAGVIPSRRYFLQRQFDTYLRALGNCKTVEAKKDYVPQTLRTQMAEKQFTDALQIWCYSESTRKKQKMYKILQERERAIKQKITDSGYGKELARNYYNIQSFPGGKVVAKLTAQDWERMKDKILAVYEWRRQETKKQHIIYGYKARIRHLQKMLFESTVNMDMNISAPATYVAQLEPFASIMKDINGDAVMCIVVDGEEISGDSDLTQLGNRRWRSAPANNDVVKGKITALSSSLPGITLAWKAEADKVLTELLLASDGPTAPRQRNTQIDRLDLAANFFACACNCKEPISYPRILMHRCVRSKQIRQSDDDEPTADDNDTGEGTASETGAPNTVYGIPTVTEEGVWSSMSSWATAPWNANGEDIWVDEEATGFAKAIIQACGQDPESATYALMESFEDLRIECMRCVPPPKSKRSAARHVMTWTSAILHDIKMHSEEPPSHTSWRRVTDSAELETIYALEQKKKDSKTFDRCCRLCHSAYQLYNANHLQIHFSTNHGHQADAEHRQYTYISLDVPMKRYPFPVKI